MLVVSKGGDADVLECLSSLAGDPGGFLDRREGSRSIWGEAMDEVLNRGK